MNAFAPLRESRMSTPRNCTRSPYFALASVPKGKDPDAAEAAIVETFEKKIGSLTSADLERAKGVIERDYDRSLNDSAALASLLSEREAGGSWKLLIVQRELTMDPDIIAALASVALKRVSNHQSITLRVSRQDFGRVRVAVANVNPAITVKDDATLERGDYVIDTAQTHLDGRVASQVDAIGRALFDE